MPKSKAPTYDEPRPKSVASAYGDFRDPVRGAVKSHNDNVAMRENGYLKTLMGPEKAIEYPTDDRPILFGTRENWLRVTERGKILPRRITGLTSKQQRDLTLSIKRSRQIALMPFINVEG